MLDDNVLGAIQKRLRFQIDKDTYSDSRIQMYFTVL